VNVRSKDFTQAHSRVKSIEKKNPTKLQVSTTQAESSSSATAKEIEMKDGGIAEPTVQE